MVNEADQVGADAGGELLNAFNVATFKSEEDDAAFWNRLIPVAKRKIKEAEASDGEPEALGIRAARLKNADDVRARFCLWDDAVLIPWPLLACAVLSSVRCRIG